ncbi:pilus biosynthesis protein PilO [Psychromonas marina]|uniref:Pilus biosynthesis protein PilO n=1 Tax=Psychromonas marina TaxID=88364 RepID=A0ABQ6DZQ5_9GAMM|nr:type 4a pilus biogenesis protein PilO [Psychromonas marina]GLS90652.1 pilus biosynthesis protein PilO [Psychromonas marina]
MDLNELDFENVGSWPALYRGVFIALVCAIFAGAFYYYVTIPQIEQLKSVEVKEQKLKDEFKVKAALSSNLEAYQAQLVEINVIFEGLINKLPNRKEIASLLDDISFIGSDNGLQIKSINWGAKKDTGELSVEVPISIQVVGTYDQLGDFAADIAALPRIVILDNLRLSKGKGDQLTLNVIAKTYRYKGESK